MYIYILVCRRKVAHCYTMFFLSMMSATHTGRSKNTHYTQASTQGLLQKIRCDPLTRWRLPVTFLKAVISVRPKLSRSALLNVLPQ